MSEEICSLQARNDHPSSYSLNNLSGDGEVVVRLAEWCVISFEYFWRVNGIFNSDDYLDRLRG